MHGEKAQSMKADATGAGLWGLLRRLTQLLTSRPWSPAESLCWLAGAGAVTMWLCTMHLSITAGVFDPPAMVRFVCLRSLLLLPACGLCLLAVRTRGLQPDLLLVNLLWLSGLCFIPDVQQSVPGFVSFARFVLPILVFGYLLFSALGPVPGRALRAASQVRHLRLWLYLLLVALYLFVGFRIFLVLEEGHLRGGDTVHYVMMAKSLAADGDLDLYNNYRDMFGPEKDFETYGFFRQHHISLFSRPGHLYSSHPCGISILLAPATAIGGEPGILIFFCCICALMGPLLFTVLGRYCADAAPRLAVTLVFTASSPFLIYSGIIYPEYVTSLLFVFAFWVAAAVPGMSVPMWVAAGTALGAVMWLLPRRGIPGLFVLTLALLWRCWREKSPRRALAFLLPLVLLFAGYLVKEQAMFPGPEMTAAGRVEVLDSSEVQGAAFYNSGRRALPLKKVLIRLFTEAGTCFPAAAMLVDRLKGLAWHNAVVLFAIPCSLLLFLRRRVRSEYFLPFLCFASMYGLASICGLSGWDAGACLSPRYVMSNLVFLAIPALLLYRDWSERRIGAAPYGVPAMAGFALLLTAVGTILPLIEVGRYYFPLQAYVRWMPGLNDFSNHVFPLFRQERNWGVPLLSDPPLIAAWVIALFSLSWLFFFSKRGVRMRAGTTAAVLCAAVLLLDLISANYAV